MAVPGLLRARPNRRTGMTGHETFALTLGELKDLVTLCECDDVLCAMSSAMDTEHCDAVPTVQTTRTLSTTWKRR